MDQKLKNEIQILINNYKYGDFKKVLSKCSYLVKKYPKNDFLWNLTGLSFQESASKRMRLHLLKMQQIIIQK